MTYCISTDVKENAIKWHVQKVLVQLNCKLFLKSNYCIRNQKHSVKMHDFSFHPRIAQRRLLSCNIGPVRKEGGGGGGEGEGKGVRFIMYMRNLSICGIYSS